MKKIVRVGLSVSLILFCLGAAEAQKIRTVEGVTIVSNGKKPSPPAGQPSHITLAEELTIGLSENLDEAFSGEIVFVVGPDGSIFALDSKDQKVKVFDKNGKFLRLIGKQGQGPGEFGMASGVQLTGDQLLLVEDVIGRKLALFKPSGEFVKNISMTGALGMVNMMLDGRGNYLGREMGLTEGNAKMFFEIKKYDQNLKPLFTLDKIEFPLPIPGSKTKMNILEMMSLYQLDSAGNIFYGRNASYEIKVYSPEGKHIRTIEKEFDRTKVTQQDIDEMLARMPNVTPGMNVKEMVAFPEYFPPYQSFVLDDQGRLFVRTFTKGKVKDEYEIDVFDAEGRFIAQFITKSDLRLFQKDKAYGVEETAEGFRVIKRYAVSWRE
jgi:hypothetical protein